MMLFVRVYWCLWFSETYSFYMPKMRHYPNTGYSGHPSFLTPFINKEKFTEGRQNCTVFPAIGNLTSYAGFLTVRTTLAYKTHLFFWFFPTERRSLFLTQLVLWMQGGTGLSSMLGVFEGNGPYYIDPDDGTIKLRQHRLTQIASVLYIDSPVGSGYSFTEDDIGHSYNKIEAAELLFAALKQFFRLFRIVSLADFFICGESYASNYVPVLAQRIKWHNHRCSYKQKLLGKKELKGKINLKGIMLGSAFLDPANMTSYYSSTLSQIGLIDHRAEKLFQKMENKIYYLTELKKFKEAYHCFDETISGGVTPYRTLFENTTSFTSCLNYKIPHVHEKYHDIVAKYVQSVEFRKSVNVGNYTFNINYPKIINYMANDIMKSVQVTLQQVIRYGIKVLIYHGQLDALVPYASVVEFEKHLNWYCSQPEVSERRWLVVERRLAGYYKEMNNLVELLVLDAGHVISKDQPMITLELTRRFIHNKLY